MIAARPRFFCSTITLLQSVELQPELVERRARREVATQLAQRLVDGLSHPRAAEACAGLRQSSAQLRVLGCVRQTAQQLAKADLIERLARPGPNPAHALLRQI